MWAAIGAETGGRVAAEVFAENAGIPGSDPAALKMLISGELDFFTLMGGILGQAVPVAEVQQVPFAFRTAAEAHEAADGTLGAYLRRRWRPGAFTASRSARSTTACGRPPRPAG
jgi:TRAP-type C4-dicarboxylate transport system substrate-binding protein